MVAERTSPPFLDQLRASALLDGAQLAELSGCPEARDPAPTPLARVVFQRGWLTRFQLNTIAAGRGKDLIVGPYVVLDRLGEGGMGMVYKARHQHMKRVVALKVIRKERLASADSVRRFYQEVQMAAALSHPNIVLAYDAGQVGNTHYFAMEYVEGVDLSRLVKDQGRLPVPQACDYIRQAALGLQHAHEKGMVHRDIKPANLLVSRAPAPAATDIAAGRSAGKGPRGDVVKILDMGLARLEGAGDTGMTKTGAVMGTPDYLAPEQAMNSRAADIRADLYSLGCTFYFLLTAKPPFLGAELTEVLLKHQMEKPAPLAKRGIEAPAGVQAVLDRLMAKDPDDRYQTPAGLVADLSPFCREGKLADEVLNSLVEDESSDDDEADGLALRDKPRAKSGRRRDAEEVQTSELSRTSAGARQIRRKRRAAREDAQRRKQLWILAGVGGAVLAAGLIVGVLYLALGRSRPAEHAQGPAPAEPPARGGPEAPGGQQPNPGGKPVVPQPGGGNPVQPPPGGGEPVKPPPGGGEPVKPPPGGGEPQPGGNVALEEPLFARNHNLLEPGQPWNYPIEPGERVAVHGQVCNTGFALAPDGKRVAILGGASVSVYDTAEPARRSRSIAHGHRDAAFSTDGKLLALAHDRPGAVVLYDPATGQVARDLWHGDDDTREVAFSPDGRWLAAGCVGRVHLWDARTWDEIPVEIKGGEGVASGLSFSSDGRTLVFHFVDTLCVWDVEGKKMRASSRLSPPSFVSALALSPDGKTVAVGKGNGAISLVASDTGKWKSNLVDQQSDRLWSLAFSPDGRTLAAGHGTTLQLWDVAGRRRITERRASPDRGELSRIVFADGGRTLLTGGASMLKVWDVPKLMEAKAR
jgi:serine/threonine protein kinase/WD40 repeat protein